MTHLAHLLAAVVAASLTISAPARAADPRYPDWPCVQAKVPEISVAAVWAGPPLDDAEKSWENDPRIKDMVPQLAQRRVSIENAQKAIADFVTGDATERERRGTLLFAGLFERINRERTEVMSGIERLGRRQKELAEKIRSDISELHKLRDATTPNEARLQELGNQVQWSTRIFEDRQKSVRYVCEVPTLIEQRLFALGRAVQQAME
jgi:hypothetical protein